MEEQSPQHLGRKNKRLYWDWWRENPVELVLVVLIIMAFALVPWEGCGISEQSVDERPAVADQQADDDVVIVR